MTPEETLPPNSMSKTSIALHNLRGLVIMIAASFLLITLLVEMAQMHAGVVRAAASAEERLAQLARLRARPDSPARGEPTQSFIHRQNIAHYRSLLESASLDEAQRRLIERLLREEEAKNGSEHRGG